MSRDEIADSFGSNHLRQILNLLPYRQLCGQFSAVLNMEVSTGSPTDVALAFADLDRNELELKTGASSEEAKPWELSSRKLDDVEMRKLKYLGHRVEQGVDDLQAHLATRWILANYVLSVIIIGAIMAVLIYTPNQFNPTVGLSGTHALESNILLGTVGLIASLVVPLGQRLFERLMSLR